MSGSGGGVQGRAALLRWLAGRVAPVLPRHVVAVGQWGPGRLDAARWACGRLVCYSTMAAAELPLARADQAHAVAGPPHPVTMECCKCRPHSLPRMATMHGVVHVAGHTQDGYDHSYFFISTFIDEHIDFAADALLGK